MIRHLRAIGPAITPRGGPLPPQQQPDELRLDYFRALEPIVDAARDAFSQERPAILRLLVVLRHEQEAKRLRTDADHGVEAQARVNAAAARFARTFQPTALHAVAKQFGRQVSAHQQRQLDQQVREAIGVPLSAIEAPVRDKIDAWATTNVELIKTVPERYFDRLRGAVEEAFAGGTHPETLAGELADRYDMALDDARRIARDQIGKLNADVNQSRQEALGVERFIWRTMNDNRVRDEHVDLDGEEFAWDEPPVVDGEEALPGQPVQCRCFAEPVLSALLPDGEDV